MTAPSSTQTGQEDSTINDHGRRRFDDKVAFVTGAAGGIGRATAVEFAREGASVAVADVDDEANAETARLVEAAGGRPKAVHCDVTRAEDVAAALAIVVQTFGGLDIAFNNAGVEQPFSPVAEIAEEQWDRVLAVSLKGIFLTMKHEIPLLLERGGGAIVNTSSGAGLKGIAGGAAYGAAKFGVIGLTKCAALDYASSGIRINAVCPGIIDTEMIQRVFGDTPTGRQAVLDQQPIGRMGRPDEIADAVLWLCSDQASFAVGHALVVDGGQTT